MFTLPAKKKSAAESVTTENALSADDYSAPPTKKLRVASSSEKNDEASSGPCWQIVFSPQHGRNYYWNPITRLSSWTLPVGAALKDAPAEQTTECSIGSASAARCSPCRRGRPQQLRAPVPVPSIPLCPVPYGHGINLQYFDAMGLQERVPGFAMVRVGA